jgi:hypothetical protein
MSDSIKGPRRTSYQIVSAILDYLENTQRSVKLNDIAIAVGTNTVVIQRWLSIIHDIQRSGQLLFEDVKGSHIRLTRTVQNKTYSFAISAKEEKEYNWIEQWTSDSKLLFEGNWTYKSEDNQGDLLIQNIHDLQPFNANDLLVDPIIAMDQYDIPEITKKQAFFYVTSWNLKLFEVDNYYPMESLEIISLLSRNLLGPLSEIQTLNLHQVLPILVPRTGDIRSTLLEDERLNEELELYVQNLAYIAY